MFLKTALLTMFQLFLLKKKEEEKHGKKIKK